MESFPIHPIVHLAIDIQPKYLRGLSKERQVSFPRDVRTFADILRRYGIPTIWVSLLAESTFHPRQSHWTPADAPVRSLEELERFDLTKIAARIDEDIFVKNHMDALYIEHLTQQLRNYQTENLIITGMKTLQCVAETVRGVLREDFRCYVMLDLLADISEPDAKYMIAWQRDEMRTTTDFIFPKEPKLRRMTKEDLDERLKYFIQPELFQFLKEKPAPPQGQTPVLDQYGNRFG